MERLLELKFYKFFYERFFFGNECINKIGIMVLKVDLLIWNGDYFMRVLFLDREL